ncbi:MAG: biotin/lipoyl-containing protein, partial [Phototrophicales bacterium]|nr:biotin/lipoyl-containing protein [Phototrophicales bacterium]
MNITYQHGETMYHLNLENSGDGKHTITINGTVYDIHATPLNDGAWLITWDGGREVVYTAVNGTERFAHADGGTYTLVQPNPQSRKRKRAGAGDDLTAQMPGKVVDVLVGAGDVVKKGQTLLLLEAMKMEIRVSAPHDGTIKAIFTQKGDVVDRGQRLVEIGE